jgi:hypothetical protein
VGIGKRYTPNGINNINDTASHPFIRDGNETKTKGIRFEIIINIMSRGEARS